MEPSQVADDMNHGGTKLRLAVEDKILSTIKDLQAKMDDLQKEKTDVHCLNRPCGQESLRTP